MIEFVDSQDPNVRSAIQRHTAYHSAAQRRDARSRLLRRSSQTRYLEWGRRPRSEMEMTTSSASSASSVSMSPAPDQTRRSSAQEQEPERSEGPASQASRSVSIPASESLPVATPSTSPPIAAEDAILQFLSTTLCAHAESREPFDAAIRFMREHEASRCLLLAYSYALRWRLHGSPETAQDHVDAQSNLGRGTNILWNQLQVSGHASSDANIQAVLLLVTYTSDFGQANEEQLHVDALRTMVDQRGGVDAFGHNSALQRQLWAIGNSRVHHLTLSCDLSCPERRRFPNGLRLGPMEEED
ncbi:uncharacterized protein Z518_10354 [Rhinocladiella mackenziei CBS 650.93]|uniref:Uncharacterized protein n=1 Tax=Rhinocladiella mackenziei CBS 650.93 TaxID=1442369 RepID=A0A0D2IAE3_9EURO|nr:uncharacterized protein Z518_10354 [Rhinocladiella mackenziei CBS 650.93]KIX00216.1 hypothetical protein Z518_10354 [Rhinocladiella mackenziei CBS 650.93]